jgi:DNA-binding transcriptional MerR regulator
MAKAGGWSMALVDGLSIGALARRTGTNPPTIRYYEAIGLLPPSRRGGGGQRIYGAADVRRVTFIRRCRNLAFPIEQIQELTSLMEDGDRSCLEARQLAHQHLSSVRAKLAELLELEKSVAALVMDCDTKCDGRPGPECSILADLSQPPAIKRQCMELGRQ